MTARSAAKDRREQKEGDRSDSLISIAAAPHQMLDYTADRLASESRVNFRMG